MNFDRSIFIALFLIVVFGSRAAATDIPPNSLLYAGFNGGLITNDSYAFKPGDAVFEPNGRVGQALQVFSTSWAGRAFVSTPQPIIQSRRGSVAFWIKLNSLDRVENIVSMLPASPGPAAIRINATPGANGQLKIDIDYDGVGPGGGPGGVRDSIASGVFNFALNEWHHFVWTWQGTHHKLYRNGAKVADRLSISAMPAVLNGSFAIGGGCCWAAPVLDELAVYNFPMNDDEAAASFASSVSAPTPASGPHGAEIIAHWAPGDGKVVVQADAGNEYALRAKSYTVDVVRDGQVVASFDLGRVVDGFAQSHYVFGTILSPGIYVAQVRMLDSSGAVLTTTNSSAFEVPATTWLGNNLGIAPAGTVQAPWIPITVAGTSLSVWGRTYDLTGGFGLPRQITSQGSALLAAPIDLDFDTGSGPFRLTAQSMAITSAANDRVTWTGSASGGGLTATVNGSLEYDGMMLLKLTLAATAAPITVNSIKLQTVMPGDRAKYYSRGATPTWQVQSYDPAVPSEPGVFFTNRQSGATGGTPLIPSIVLSDDHRGLEWFADNLNGWVVNQSMADPTPFQLLSVDPDRSVRLENVLAAQPFELSAPLTITFGYEATPMRPLPMDWRAMQIAVTGNTPALPNVFALSWSYSDDRIRGHCGSSLSLYLWEIYALIPGSCTSVAEDAATIFRRAEAQRKGGIYFAPYTQQHTLRGPTNAPPNDTSSLLGFLRYEFANPADFGAIGYISMPTRGATDFWLSSMDYNLSNGIIQSVYIDEPYYFANISAPVIGGSGYLDPTLIARNGYNSLGVRTQLQRLRQLFIDYGLRPSIWIDASSGYVAPHMWAFADIVSDGEGLFVLKPDDPDFIDLYNTPKGINWLRGISRTEKFGWVQGFLDEVRVYTHSSYRAHYRAMIAMLTLFDIFPTSSPLSWDWRTYLKARIDFGMLNTGAAFSPYWTQTAITSNAPDVVCSYYAIAAARLVHCANLGSTDYVGAISINQDALGVAGTLTATDAETQAALAYTSGAVPQVTIRRHDYRVIRLDAG